MPAFCQEYLLLFLFIPYSWRSGKWMLYKSMVTVNVHPQISCRGESNWLTGCSCCALNPSLHSCWGFPQATPSQWLSPAGLQTQTLSHEIEDPSMGDSGLRPPSQPECKLPYNWAAVWDSSYLPINAPSFSPSQASHLHHDLKALPTSSSSLPALLPAQAFP